MWRIVGPILGDKVAFVTAGLMLTYVLFQSPVWYAEHKNRLAKAKIDGVELAKQQAEIERRKALHRLAFEDVIEYYAIVPPVKTVAHGSKARFVSLMEVKPVIVGIRGGVRLDWTEEVYCDLDLQDGVLRYSYYAEAEPSGKTYNAPSESALRETISELDGFPVKEKRSAGQKGKLESITYPEKQEAPNGADCILRSGMVMAFEDQIRWIEMHSEVAHVRDMSTN